MKAINWKSLVAAIAVNKSDSASRENERRKDRSPKECRCPGAGMEDGEKDELEKQRRLRGKYTSNVLT